MDIKENNILITHCPENERNPLTGYLPIKFKLADFGISISVDNQNYFQPQVRNISFKKKV